MDSYSKMYNCDKVDKYKIIEEIKKNDIEICLGFLARLSFLNYVEANDLYSLFSDFNNRKNHYTLITKQGLAVTYKWFLAYGNQYKYDLELNTNLQVNLLLKKVILIQLMIADYIVDIENSPSHFIFRNLQFNKSINPINAAHRAKAMFSSPTSLELKIDNEILDFHSQFQETYGYTIDRYFETMVTLIPCFNKGYQENTLGLEIKSLESNFYNITKVINTHRCDLNEAKKWAIDTIDNIWDFELFYKYPLITVQEFCIIPFSLDMLSNSIFNGLSHLIFDLYENKRAIRGCIGALFENYITEIIEVASKTLKSDKYIFIPEFRIGDNDSSDAYLKYEDVLFAFECKGNRPTIKARMTSNDEDYKDEVKCIKKYLKQPRIFNDYLHENHCNAYLEKFGNVREVFYIIVNYENFTLEKFWRDSFNDASNYLSNTVTLSAEELEYFAGLIINFENSFELIINYLKSNMDNTFLNYLNDNRVDLKDCNYYKEKANILYENE